MNVKVLAPALLASVIASGADAGRGGAWDAAVHVNVITACHMYGHITLQDKERFMARTNEYLVKWHHTDLESEEMRAMVNRALPKGFQRYNWNPDYMCQRLFSVPK